MHLIEPFINKVPSFIYHTKYVVRIPIKIENRQQSGIHMYIQAGNYSVGN